MTTALNKQHIILLISGIGCFITAILFAASVLLLNWRQQAAYGGDEIAANKIVLPCYKPIYTGLSGFFTILGVAQCLCMVDTYNEHKMYKIAQFNSMCVMAGYLIFPVLVVQHGVSMQSLKVTAIVISVWFALVAVIWGIYYDLEDDEQFATGFLFLLLSCALPALLSIGILTRVIPSRLQLGSVSSRASCHFMLFYAIAFALFNILFLVSGETRIIDAIGLTTVTIVMNFFFPLALHRSLLADTKYWRGLGTHNVRGIKSESADTLPKPTMDVQVASTVLQDMMLEVGNIAIDFAYLEARSRIGKGATSEVYEGFYKKEKVAIKIYTPGELTREEIQVFVKEGSVNADLVNEHIIKFHGLCIRPPQIAMVLELCEHGSLKSSIETNPSYWTPLRRLTACLHATKALAYLHSMGYIHRDLKTENFFVSGDGVTKLGDFGESKFIRQKQVLSPQSAQNAFSNMLYPTSNAGTVSDCKEDSEVGDPDDGEETSRMTILGTVSYMAPELIAAARTYTDRIDIYALGITFWEIWTGKEAHQEHSQFDIYKIVEEGKRPSVDMDVPAPAEFVRAMTDAWHQSAEQRPSAQELVYRLEGVVRACGGVVESTPTTPAESPRAPLSARVASMFTGAVRKGNLTASHSPLGTVRDSRDSYRESYRDTYGRESAFIPLDLKVNAPFVKEARASLESVESVDRGSLSGKSLLGPGEMDSSSTRSPTKIDRSSRNSLL
jgi:serine/threonine protein kinase